MKTTLKTSVCLFTLSTLALNLPVPGLAEESSKQRTEKPNVVFILADDLGYAELGCYGQDKIRTPHLDQLAADGMRFTQHYCGAPVCAPSRSVLLTGLHLGHTPIRNNKEYKTEGQFPLPDESYTLAELFKEQGYATGAFGKWGLGFVDSSGDPNKQGFDTFYGYNCQRVAHSYYPPHLWHNNEKVIINEKPIPGHQKQPTGEVCMADWQGENYAPDLILDQALQFIDTHKDEPFFLYLPFIEPHVAIQPHPEDVARYPEAWDAETGPYRGQAGYLPHPRPRAGYAAMITDLDEHVGDVLSKLKEHGLDDNTLVIFTSDNGATIPTENGHIGGADTTFFQSNGKFRGYKGTVYEGGLRVPMIARWPGHIQAGTVSEQPSYFPDYMATFCDLLKISVSKRPKTDGQSLLPVLTTGKTFKHAPMVWAYGPKYFQLALRMDNWKLVYTHIKRQGRQWELYDLRKDPSETHNVAKQHAEVLQAGIRILNEQVSDNRHFPVTVPE